MKLVIQCAGKKHEDAGRLKNASGQEVIFVAHPEKYVQSAPPSLCYRPDDDMVAGLSSWREYLAHYNRQGSNPDGLFRAADLYMPTVYQAMVERYGRQHVFILSAGWGLIRSDFWTPYYDITFSNQGKPWSKRRPRDRFDDFNQLSNGGISPDEAIYFFGGKDYLPLYYSLTQSISARKVIYHSQGYHGQRSGYEYISYRSYTNWHYSCAQDFMADRIPK